MLTYYILLFDLSYNYLALLGEACWMRISSPLLATD